MAENAFEFGLVGLLDVFEGDVDALADVGLVALGVETVEVGGVGELKTFAGKTTGDADRVTFIFSRVTVAVIFNDVADVFHEQHHEDVVLVVRRIEAATEGIAGTPRDVVDLVLIDVGHGRKGSGLRLEGLENGVVDQGGTTAGESFHELLFAKSQLVSQFASLENCAKYLPLISQRTLIRFFTLRTSMTWKPCGFGWHLCDMPRRGICKVGRGVMIDRYALA